MTAIPSSEFVKRSKQFSLQDVLDTVSAAVTAATPTDTTQVVLPAELDVSAKNKTLGQVVHTCLAVIRGTLANSAGSVGVPTGSIMRTMPVKRWHLRTIVATAVTG